MCVEWHVLHRRVDGRDDESEGRACMEWHDLHAFLTRRVEGRGARGGTCDSMLTACRREPHVLPPRHAPMSPKGTGARSKRAARRPPNLSQVRDCRGARSRSPSRRPRSPLQDPRPKPSRKPCSHTRAHASKAAVVEAATQMCLGTSATRKKLKPCPMLPSKWG